MAAKTETIAPALSLLRWPDWSARADAMGKSFVMKVWETGLPRSLRALLPAKDSAGQAFQASRLRERGCYLPREHRKNMGKKAFGSWATDVLNAVVSCQPPRKSLGSRRSACQKGVH